MQRFSTPDIFRANKALTEFCRGQGPQGMSHIFMRQGEGFRKMRIFAVLVMLALAALTGPLLAQPLHVAAASDLTGCIDKVNTGFEKTMPGVNVKVSLGASGNFFAQIKHGAPFDVFLSADMKYPAELAAAGLADKASLFAYAHGRLALLSSNASFDPTVGFRLLADPAISRIAIANPDVAPYGRAAKAAIEQAGLWNAVKSRLVFGENIAQTLQFVTSGNAQVGVVSAAQLHALSGSSPSKMWILPADSHPAIEQGAILTRKGKTHPAALQYLRFLRSEQGRDILGKCGFTLPKTGN